MVISEKQILQLLDVLKMKLDDFEMSFHYRLNLYGDILNQQSEELREINDQATRVG